MEQDTNISLEEHLIESLRTIHSVLPENIGEGLKKYISEPPASHIPCSILTKISKWSRSDEGSAKLKAEGLDPNSYSTVSLLAGTISSPERKFGNYVPPKDVEEVAAERARERKAIAALANAVLSVAGVGVGTYWVSDKTGWKNEWRALFAFSASIIVAIAEAGLFLIWQWRKTEKRPRYDKSTGENKKLDPPAETSEPPENRTEKIRRRRK